MNIILFLVQYFGFLILIPLLARRFAYPARPKACDKRRRIVIRRDSSGRRTPPGCKYTAKMKTKPFQSHSKPFFRRSNLILSPKMGILDKFRTTFLCKTKPFFSKIQIENKGLTTVSKSKCGGLSSTYFEAVSQTKCGVYPVPTLRLFRKLSAGFIPYLL